MSLEEVKRSWTRLGEQDPLWAVLVEPGKRKGGWNIDEFFAVGERDVAGARSWLERLGLPTEWERVLDFGCGAGRLSQALAKSAGEVVGVDVSGSMLETARRFDRSGGRCKFVLNDAPDLRIFPDADFDFVFSQLVLQHLPADVIFAYLGEFMRVLRPGGLAVLQCTTRPLSTLKGAIWRVAPYRLVALGQRVVLRYPAPMRMTAIAPDHFCRVIEEHGGQVVDARAIDDRATHWRSTHYVVRRLP